MKKMNFAAAVLAAATAMAAGSAGAGGPIVLGDTQMDGVTAGSAFSLGNAIATAVGRGTFTLTGANTTSFERFARRATGSDTVAFAAGDRFAVAGVVNESTVAGSGGAVYVATDTGALAARGTARGVGRTRAAGNAVVSVAYGTSTSVGIGERTNATAAAGSGGAGTFLAISGQVVVPVNAGQASVGVAVPWAVAVSLPSSVNALLGR